MKDLIEKISPTKAGLWDLVKALSTILVVGVICYKIYLTPINMTVDFPTLLSLLLALFSVALAAMFYFKATDTSNTFYDNTYNFTKDIAQLLVKIESGFGERLRNLDEGYTSMRDYLQHSSEKPNENVEKTKRKIEDEKDGMEKVLQERNKIIQDLFERSNLQEEEKSRVKEQLKEKENELAEAQKELTKMNKKLLIERIDRKRNRELDIDADRGISEFTRRMVIEEIGVDHILNAPASYIARSFDKLVKKLPREYIEDLERRGYFENGLTPKGCEFLSLVARKGFA